MNTDAPSASRKALTPAFFIRCALALGLAVLTYFLCFAGQKEVARSEAGVKLELPATVDGFTGKPIEVSASEKEILPKDTGFARMLYSDPGGDQVNCQIVLSGGEKRSIHRPEICLPGQGWTKRSAEVVSVPMADGTKLDVMKLTITRPVEVRPGEHKELTSLFIYWFVGKNLTTPYHFYRIIHTDLDRVFYNVSHRWAYIIVSSPVWAGFKPNGKDEAATLDELKKFIADVAPQIMLPIQKDKKN